MTAAVDDYPLELVNLFVLNEIEGRELTGERESEAILAGMRHRFPNADTVIITPTREIMPLGFVL